MAIAGGNITLDSTEGMDRITQTDKLTSPYHSDGNTKLSAANIVSSSLTDTNETYFFGISNNGTPTVEEFNVVEPSEKYGVVTFSVWVILSIPSVESNDMFPPAIAIL